MAELSSLQLIAEAGWANNTAIAISNELTLAIDDYVSTPLLVPLANAIANASNAFISGSTKINLILLASNTVPAFSNSPPVAFISSLANILSQYGNITPANPTLANTTLSNIVIQVGQTYLSGNLYNPINTSIFSQIFQAAQGFTQQNNLYLNALTDINSNIAPTFTDYNNYITGDLTKVTLATLAFGQDLEKLGFAVNLENIDNLGSPAALLAQIVSFGGFVDVLAQLLAVQGVPIDVVVDLTDPNYAVSDDINRKIYLAFGAITTTTAPSALSQILAVLNVTTPNITGLVDLLNPVKMFPSSFQALSVPTEKGSTAIYLNSAGAVNTSLLTLLPSYVINTISE
jgi:hypothetical protein